MADEAAARKAEVRKRLEEEAQAKKKKKGFMTPARKKKLRMLLRKKAAEELKREQELKQAERKRIINERCGDPRPTEHMPTEGLVELVEQYHNRILECESQKYDLELKVMINDYEIIELNRKVLDLRGKFIKPQLKKVSMAENKFAKLQQKATEFNFKTALKHVPQ
ncbi:unnamed protein product, partial [Meganyctiphanes norvegica]|uniref:Troponin I n=1 Tax=Meganyctiphanes norvegica TaxID=48144 RepID=A0AAV2RG59_MEGNR